MLGFSSPRGFLRRDADPGCGVVPPTRLSTPTRGGRASSPGDPPPTRPGLSSVPSPESFSSGHCVGTCRHTGLSRATYAHSSPCAPRGQRHGRSFFLSTLSTRPSPEGAPGAKTPPGASHRAVPSWLYRGEPEVPEGRGQAGTGLRRPGPHALPSGLPSLSLLSSVQSGRLWGTEPSQRHQAHVSQVQPQEPVSILESGARGWGTIGVWCMAPWSPLGLRHIGLARDSVVKGPLVAWDDPRRPPLHLTVLLTRHWPAGSGG